MNRFRELVLAAIIASAFAFPVAAADPPVLTS